MGAIDPFAGALDPVRAVVCVLARYDRAQLAALIEFAIELTDNLDGDAEAEQCGWPEDLRAVDKVSLPDDAEAAGDEHDATWIEWTKHERAAPCKIGAGGNEDDEPDDHAEEDDPAGQCDEDEINTYAKGTGPWYQSDGPGCPISDPGDHWAQTSNVPVSAAVSLQHNIFNDQRMPMGIVNLQTSYIAGGEVFSADSGNRLRRRPPRELSKPGAPV